MKTYQEKKIKITRIPLRGEKAIINILVYLLTDFNQHLYAL